MSHGGLIVNMKFALASSIAGKGPFLEPGFVISGTKFVLEICRVGTYQFVLMY